MIGRKQRSQEHNHNICQYNPCVETEKLKHFSVSVRKYYGRICIVYMVFFWGPV